MLHINRIVKRRITFTANGSADIDGTANLNGTVIGAFIKKGALTSFNIVAKDADGYDVLKGNGASISADTPLGLSDLGMAFLGQNTITVDSLSGSGTGELILHIAT